MAVDKTKLILNPLSGKFDAVQDVSALTTTAYVDATFIPLAQKAAANGVATLDASGKLTASQTSAIAITDTYVVGSQAAMLALTLAETGDIAVRTDLNKTFILKGTTYSTLADWQELLTPTDAVLSVNGQTGTVVLTTTNVAEGTNLYYTDARAKAAAVANVIVGGVTNVAPSQNAVFDALATKQATGNYITALTGDITATGPGSAATTLATVNSNVGSFGSASSTTSVTVNAKGLVTAASSNAIAIAQSQVTSLVSDLALKAPLASPALTGTPTVPTAAAGTSTTQAASTAFVLAQSSNNTPGNYIIGGSAESVAASIFVPYLNTAQRLPVTGTGGSPTVTTTVSAVAPLSGTSSYLLTKPASNTQGQGWSIPLNVPLASRAKSVKISADYIVNSGTFVAGSNTTDSDIIWYIFDATSSQLIEPSNIKMFSNSTTLSDKFEATFQTSATGSSYRLIAHCATTSALAYELKVDNITITPSVYVYGSPITDYQSFTGNINGYTSGTLNVGTGGGAEKRMEWARSGSEILINYYIRVGTTGTTDVVNVYMLPFPAGIVPLTDAYDVAGYGEITTVGSANAVARLTGKFFGGGIILDKTDTTMLTGGDGVLFNNANRLTFSARFKVQGWSSSVRMSDGYDGRDVAAKLTCSTSFSVASATLVKIPFNLANIDTVVGFDLPNNRYYIKTAGKYLIAGQIGYAGTTALVNAAFRLYKNGSAIAVLDQGKSGAASTSLSVNITTMLDLKAGDYLEVYTFQASGSTLTVNGDAQALDITNLTISKLSGSQTISASELVAASFTGASLASTSGVAYSGFSSKYFDTHDIVKLSTGEIKIPLAGIYKITVNSSRTSVGGNTLNSFVNGVQNRPINTWSAVGLLMIGSVNISLNSGDTVTLRPDGAVTLTNIFVDIEKIK